MGNTEVVSQILDFVPEIDFSVSFNDTVVSVFETTIRYLGGLLSGTKSRLSRALALDRGVNSH